MYVTEATTGQQELTVQIDISMPHLSQNDLNAYPGINNKRFSKRSNSQENKRQSVYHKRCALEELLEPALSPSNSQGSGSGGSGTGSHQGKKPFVTVVKTGTFLEPPDKMSCYLKNQHAHGGSQVLVYSYCSRPRVMQPAIKVRSRENLKFNVNNNNNNSSLNNLNYYQTNNKTILQTNNNNFKNKRSINNNEINRYLFKFISTLCVVLRDRKT